MKLISLLACLVLPLLAFPARAEPQVVFRLSAGTLPSQTGFLPIPAAPPRGALPQKGLTISSPEIANFGRSHEKCADCIVISENKRLAPEEMREVRGGFIDPTGLVYNFAVNVRTALNGAEVFTRTITVSPAVDRHLQATVATALLTEKIPKDLSVKIVGEGKGLFVSNADGGHSLILNQTPQGIPISAVLNTLSNSDINQTVSMTLKLNQVTPMLNALRSPLGAALEQNSAIRSLGLR